MKSELWIGKTSIDSRGKNSRFIPHSLNARLHWVTRSKWNKAWKDAVWAEVLAKMAKHRPKLPAKFARVEVVLLSCNTLDRDNAYSAAKPIVDGLRYAGVLTDDTDEYLDLKVRSEKADHIAYQGVKVFIDWK